MECYQQRHELRSDIFSTNPGKEKNPLRPDKSWAIPHGKGAGHVLVEKEKMGGGGRGGLEGGRKEKRKKNKEKKGRNQDSLARLPASQTWGISHSEMHPTPFIWKDRRTEHKEDRGDRQRGERCPAWAGHTAGAAQPSLCPELGLKLAGAFSLPKSEESLGSRLWRGLGRRESPRPERRAVVPRAVSSMGGAGTQRGRPLLRVCFASRPPLGKRGRHGRIPLR